MKEAFKWVLVGAVILFILTTILTMTGLAASPEGENILFFLRIASLVAAIASTVGLILK